MSSFRSCSAPILYWRCLRRRLPARPAALVYRIFDRMAILRMECMVFVRMAFVRTQVRRAFVRTRQEIGCRRRTESLAKPGKLSIAVSPSPKHTLATLHTAADHYRMRGRPVRASHLGVQPLGLLVRLRVVNDWGAPAGGCRACRPRGKRHQEVQENAFATRPSVLGSPAAGLAGARMRAGSANAAAEPGVLRAGGAIGAAEPPAFCCVFCAGVARPAGWVDWTATPPNQSRREEGDELQPWYYATASRKKDGEPQSAPAARPGVTKLS